jgi:hypothetical protein
MNRAGLKGGVEWKRLSHDTCKTIQHTSRTIDMVFLLCRYVSMLLLTMAAYITVIWCIFGCKVFIAVAQENNTGLDESSLLFTYGLFRRQDEHGLCQVWTIQSLYGDWEKNIVDDDDNENPLLSSRQQWELGQVAAMMGTLSSTVYVILMLSNICLRIPNTVMRQLGGSLAIITLLLFVAVMVPLAHSMPFCNQTATERLDSSSSSLWIACRSNQSFLFSTCILWLIAGIGVTFLGDLDVDQVLYRRRSDIEFVSELYPTKKQLESDNDNDEPFEGGVANIAPTLDDILMLDYRGDNDETLPGIHDESLAECVRSLQLLAITQVDNIIMDDLDDDSNGLQNSGHEVIKVAAAVHHPASTEDNISSFA